MQHDYPIVSIHAFNNPVAIGIPLLAFGYCNLVVSKFRGRDKRPCIDAFEYGIAYLVYARSAAIQSVHVSTGSKSLLSRYRPIRHETLKERYYSLGGVGAELGEETVRTYRVNKILYLCRGKPATCRAGSSIATYDG